jgi:hypothetical protein
MLSIRAAIYDFEFEFDAVTREGTCIRVVLRRAPRQLARFVGDSRLIEIQRKWEVVQVNVYSSSGREEHSGSTGKERICAT